MYKPTTQRLLAVLMLVAAGLSFMLTPRLLMADNRPATPLEQIIPTQFGEWRERVDRSARVVDPQIQAELRRIYTQIVTRTYVNQRGQEVMLSVAYGKDQSDTTQVHYPEVCYPAQGFQLQSNVAATLVTANGSIPVRRLETSLENQRFEPVTYWTTVGDVAVASRLDKKLAEMRYGFHGQIPDGLLFRVSSINRDAAQAFAVQDSFVQQLLAHLDHASRLRLAGLAN